MIIKIVRLALANFSNSNLCCSGMSFLIKSSQLLPRFHIWCAWEIMNLTFLFQGESFATEVLSALPCYSYICCSSLFSGQDSGGECGIPYVYRFAMPRPSLNEPWYMSLKTLCA